MAPSEVDPRSWEAVGRGYMTAWANGDLNTMRRFGVEPTGLHLDVTPGPVTCEPPDAEGRAFCRQPLNGAFVFVELTQENGVWSVSRAGGAG